MYKSLYLPLKSNANDAELLSQYSMDDYLLR